jgi:gas vesicle protein
MRTDGLLMFLAGLGIGAAAAVLLAPYAGSETRQRILDSANQAGDRLKEQAQKLSSATQDLASQGIRTWADAQERGSEAASEIKSKVGNKIDELADNSRSVAHDAGAKLEQSGRRLQDA